MLFFNSKFIIENIIEISYNYQLYYQYIKYIFFKTCKKEVKKKAHCIALVKLVIYAGGLNLQFPGRQANKRRH